MQPLTSCVQGPLNGELGCLAAAISRDMCVEPPGVTWDDVIGLDDAKRLLHEAVVAPMR